jgi:hypothetical protein
MDKDHDKGMNRREFIRKAAITGAVAWAVPAIQTVAATPAYAGTQGTTCPHSTPDTAGGSCMGSCHSRGFAACGKDCGGGCAGICNTACSGGQCPPQYCNPLCFNVTSCSGGCTVQFTC